MAHPFISIIINNYNFVDYLGVAIDSALNQTYSNSEVIVVDDGSTDGSGELIESYGARVIPIFKENGGQGSACNAGFKKSSGDLLWFLDSDDYLNAHALDYVAKNYKESVSIYYTRLQKFSSVNADLGLIPSGELPHQGNINDTLQRGVRDLLPPTSALVFSRKTLDEVMPIEPEDIFRYSADIFMTTRSCFRGEILGIDTVAGNYRVHPTNHTYLAEFKPELIKVRMIREMKTHSIRLRDAKLFNMDIPKDYAVWDVGHVQNRIFNYILNPDDHPVKNDSRVTLWAKSLIAVFKNSKAGFKRKFMQASKFSIYVICTRGMLLSLMEILRKSKERKS